MTDEDETADDILNLFIDLQLFRITGGARSIEYDTERLEAIWPTDQVEENYYYFVLGGVQMGITVFAVDAEVRAEQLNPGDIDTTLIRKRGHALVDDRREEIREALNSFSDKSGQ